MNKIKLLLAGIIALGAIVGCNKENNEGGSLLEGKETYASFSVQVATPTRAGGTDENADAVEQNIKSLNVYVFNVSYLLEATGEITLNENNKGTTTLKTTLGPKTIVAVTNNNLNPTIGTTTLSEFKKSQIAAVPAKENIAKENEFVMSGISEKNLTETWTEDQAKEDANLIPIKVSRLPAKVQVKGNPSSENFCKPVVDAKAKEVKWMLAQQSKNSYLWQENQYDITCKIPTGKPEPAKIGHFYNFVDGSFLNKTYPDAYKSVVADYDGLFANSDYLAENVNEKPVTGNTSCIILVAKFIVKNWAGADGVRTDASSSLTEPTTFYVVKQKDVKVFAASEDKILYFQNETDADNYRKNVLKDEESGAPAKSKYEVVKYTDGISYYRLNLHTKESDLMKKYAVLRNTYYKTNVTSIDYLGDNTIKGVIPEDPDTPLEVETNISCKIEIAPWTVIENAESLK